jgi:radical SAM protein with 4Fe4S-binding SPASM domain
MSKNLNFKEYSTDGKVRHLSNEEDINVKLSKIIGPKFVEYRKKWDAVNRMEIVTDFPMFLQLDMNQKCNYKCPHCIIGHKKEVEEYYEGEYLTFEDFKKIVDEGSEYGCPSLSPQGNNEPFLIKDLHKYINYAHKKGFIDIMLNNNGSSIPIKRAQEILDSGLTRIRFSLDAITPETYKKVRVGSIPLEKVIKNIEDFLNLKEKGGYKLPVVGVSFCKVKQNEHEVDQFIDFWKDKVDLVSIQKFMPPTTNKEKYKEYYSSDQYYEKPVEKFHCVQPYQRLTFRNEYMYPCCVSFNKDLKLGSIKTDTIYNAWNSKKMNELRELHKKGDYSKNKTCKDCVNLIYPPEQDFLN